MPQAMAKTESEDAIPHTPYADLHGSPSNLQTAASNQDLEPASPSPPPSTTTEKQPNGGYGWVCVAACFLINAHTWGVNSAFGVFLSYYLSTAKFPGAIYLDFAFVGGLSIAGAGFVSPLATATTRRYGTRTTLLIGIFLETISLIGASFAGETWQLFLSQGAGFGFGMGFLFVGTVGVVPQFFTTRRSLANGIATAGSGLGGMMYSLATGAMLRSLGLAWTFRVLAIVACAINLVCAMLIRDRNKAIGASQKSFDYRLFARMEFLLFEAWFVFSILGYVVLLFTLPDYVRSVGLTAEQGAVVGALLNLGQGLGRPLIGIFSDRAGRINMAALLTFFCGFLCLVCWIFATNYGVLIFFAILGGAAAGTVWPTAAPVSAEIVGLKELPSALSITWLMLTLPAAFSEAIGLEIHAASGTYLYLQIYAGLMYIIASICAWWLRTWKIGQLECVAAQEEKSGREIDVTAHELQRTFSRDVKARRSTLLRRLIAWRRV